MARPKEQDFVNAGFRMSRDIHKAAKHRAIEEGIPLQDLIGRALQAYLAERAKKKKRGA